MALGADPPLTSVDMCLEDVGRVAAEHLLRAINGEPTHGAHTVPCRLVVRGSSVPAARRAGERPTSQPRQRPGTRGRRPRAGRG